MDYETIAVELIQALRGRRSCAELSRRAGYRSNIVHRWEARQCWPTAANFLRVQRRIRREGPTWIERFFHAKPDFLTEHAASSPESVSAFLRWLKGKTPIVQIAERMGRNRYSVSRWFEGSAEPKLPDFLSLVDVAGRRLLDLIAAVEDPLRIPSIRENWTRLQLAREAAYRQPFSHAVLRALELSDNPPGGAAQKRFIAARLGIGSAEVDAALQLLTATGQVQKTRRGWKPKQVMTVDTNHDPLRARDVKLAWTKTALSRIERGDAGNFGYSLFAISKADLARLETLHLQYVRAMQAIIAESKPNQCVGLYCSQLLDLGAVTR